MEPTPVATTSATGEAALTKNPVADNNCSSICAQPAPTLPTPTAPPLPVGNIGDLVSPHGIVKLGLSWEVTPGQAVDLDASAVCFSNTGVVIDAAYYNQLSACNGGITHSGDCRDGSIEGFDEVITIDLDRTFGCDVIALVLSSSHGGSLKSCETADVDISQNGVAIQRFPCVGPQTGNYTSVIIGLVYKDYNTRNWRYKTVFQPAHGRHFSDCLKQIRNVVDTVLDPHNVGERIMSQEKAFKMNKTVSCNYLRV
jgi:stress response protein SCP2